MKIKQINYIHLSGQIYSNPVENSGKNPNSSGYWMIRKIRVIIASNQWIDFIFEDVEIWNQVKDLPIGYYIEVHGELRNNFSRKFRGDKAQIEVKKVVHFQPVRTTSKSKFLMSKEIIDQRKFSK